MQEENRKFKFNLPEKIGRRVFTPLVKTTAGRDRRAGQILAARI